MRDAQTAGEATQGRRSGRIVFAHLRTRLTVLYAGLFVLTLLLIGAAVYAAVARNAERVVRKDLAVSGAVFDRIMTFRTAELESAAALLARDFGFRAAVATGDAATTASALENLRGRLLIDLAFVVDLDGGVTFADGGAQLSPPVGLLDAVQSADADAAGLFSAEGRIYFGVSTPIEAPSLSGWLVFARRVDDRALAELAAMSAIPLDAAVVVLDGARAAATEGGVAPTALKAALGRDAAAPGSVVMLDGAATLFGPLPTLATGERSVLVLRYPLDAALAPYRPLVRVLLILGLLSLTLIVIGSWSLARTITGPIQALEDAARRLKDGERVPVDASGGDEVASLAASFNRMAAGVQARERALESARDRAEAANRAKEVFLANMSHELRTPLNGVLGLSSVLGAGDLDARQQDMVRLIETSAVDLQRVLGDVLDLASLEAGTAALTEAPLDLHRLAWDVAAAASAEAALKGLAFESRLDLPEATWVTADAVRLRQVIGALLSNAVKFTAAGGIELTMERDGDQFTARVRDTGPGFDMAAVEDLFTPFRQGDGSSTRRFGGAGLGLSLARAFARAMGGDLTAEGASGEGATFSLTLPLASAAAPVTGPARAPVEAAPASYEVVRVLVADDHETNRTVVRLILDAAGVETVLVENGAEALAAFRSQTFAAVLMDIQMPVMDGLEAIRGMRGHEAKTAVAPTPIVVLSANALAAHRAESLAAGADDHVNKPVTAPALIAALNRALFGEEIAQAA